MSMVSNMIGAAWVQLRDDAGACRWLHVSNPARTIRAEGLDEVMPALEAAEAETASGRVVVGFLSYQAAPAFDPACVVHPGQDGLPLAWFGVYAAAEPVASPTPGGQVADCDWSPDTSRADYESAIARIRDYIAAGDTYQVNFTTRLTTPFDGDPAALFADLLTYQPHGYAAYLDIGDHVICSLSPELFFALDGHRITCRPMKGTATRGVNNAQDRERAETLRTCPKNRAENVMIVDMIRNDLGRIADPGSVRVDRLYDIERYRTVLQMTSTVTARTSAGIPEIFRALFPCASITGAPKIRTMQIIRELETSPRGIYTGCIGILQPGRRAQFNVAIRTAHVDRSGRQATYGTGGGVVWDSTAADEYRECLTKALVLRPPPPGLHLLETLLWTPETGYHLLDQHLDRLLDSAIYFDIRLARARALAALTTHADAFSRYPQRVRLLTAEDGSMQVEHTAMPSPPFSDDPEQCLTHWRVALAPEPIDPANRFLYHKTTRRDVYKHARASAPEADDVLLWNPRGELTESCRANLVLRLHGRWLTPPVSSGLLAGTYRRHLVEQGRIEEAVVPVARLPAADQLFLVNSVRGWIRAEIAPVGPNFIRTFGP